MAYYFLDNIYQGPREFDNNAQPLSNYFGFAWEGLEEAGYLTQDDYNNYLSLNSIVVNDNNQNHCND